MIDLRGTQRDLWDWQLENFGQPKGDFDKDMALGMSEEVGELCHHILKGSQGIREGINGTNRAEVEDAIIDTFIYGIQLLSYFNFDVEQSIRKVVDSVLDRDWKKNPEGV